jgi:hypothetical protein
MMGDVRREHVCVVVDRACCTCGFNFFEKLLLIEMTARPCAETERVIEDQDIEPPAESGEA